MKARTKAPVAVGALTTFLALSAVLGAPSEAQPPASDDLVVGVPLQEPNDPEWHRDARNFQWSLHNNGESAVPLRPAIEDADVDALEAWSITTGSPDVTIAIVDSGVDYRHPDLVAGHRGGWDFGDNDADPDDTSDRFRHGTSVAAIAVASGNNGIGMIGVAPDVSYLAVKVARTGVDDDGERKAVYLERDLAAGLRWSVDQGADIIQVSIGAPHEMPEVKAALEYARDNGVFTVCAAGNSAGTPNWPGLYGGDLCFAVASTDRTDTRAPDSTFGDHVDVAAPGQHVHSPLYGYFRATTHGTSFAAPHVSGTAALMLSVDSNLTPEDLARILRDTAEDVNGATHPGFDRFLGAGRINAHHAVLQAAGMLTCDGRRVTIVGTSSDDIITGTNGPDVIHAGGGSDEVYSLEGHDVVCGGAEDDLLVDLGGNSRLYGQDGNDTVWAGEGNDVVLGGNGNDALFGENGNDRANGQNGDDTVFGGAGSDRIWLSHGNDVGNGGPGWDRVDGGPGNDELAGEGGRDTLLGRLGADRLFGGDGDDRLYGGADADLLVGNAGQDELFGNFGDDELYGDIGDDYLDGGHGADVVIGQAGDDALFGGDGDDFLNGGPGTDTADGGAGDLDYCQEAGEQVATAGCEWPQ